MDWNKLKLVLVITASSVPPVVTMSCSKSPSAAAPSSASLTPGRPEMHVVSVSVPTDVTKPLAIAFELCNKSQTTTAVSQSQFSAALMTEEQPWLFTGPLSFPPDAPAVFTLKPGDRISLTATAQDDRTSGKAWSELAPKKSTLRVYISSGKDQQFPDQWLGQTYSDDCTVTRGSSK